MGAADAVPGVSGGTIALVTGVYERLVDALSIPDKQEVFTGLSFLSDRDVRGLGGFLQHMDIPFLIVLMSGVATSLVLVLNIMSFLLELYTVSTYGFFFGLILISAVSLREEFYLSTLPRKFSAVSGFVFAFAASGLSGASMGHTPLILFFSGALAVSAMILPGVSGSLFLVVLGQYEYVSSLVSNATSSVRKIFFEGSVFEFLSDVFPLVVFMSGGIIGVFVTVSVIEKALARYREASMTFLIALMLGALRSPLVQVSRSIPDSTGLLSVVPGFFLGSLLGGFAVLIVDRATSDA